MSKKAKIIIAIIIGVLIIAVAGILILINSRWFKENLIKKDLRAMTEEFYGYYYDDNSKDKKISEYLEQFKTTGLSITLGDLKVFLENRNNKKYDSKNLEKCDVAKTKMTMYPESPYSKSDLRIEFEINCK